MTVQELIDKLSQCPPDKQVEIASVFNGYDSWIELVTDAYECSNGNVIITGKIKF